MIGATAGAALFLILLQLFRYLPLTFLFFGLQQLSVSFFWPPIMGWLSQNIEGKTLNKAMARFNLSWSFGLLISPTAAGFLSERNPGLPVLGAIILFLATLLLIVGAALAVPRDRSSREKRGTEEAESAAGDNSTPLRFPAWIGIFAGFVVTGMIITIFPLFARDSLHLSKSGVGNLLSIRVFARIIGFFIIGRLSFWHFRGRYQIASMGFLVAMMLLMMHSHSVLFFSILIGAAALGNSFTYANSMFHSVAGSTRRAGRLAIHESLLAGGYIVGSAVGGILYQHFSFREVIVFCALCCSAALIAQTVIVMKVRGKVKLWQKK
jgi:MFS family permease